MVTKFLGKSLLLIVVVGILQFLVFAPFHRLDPLKKFEACVAQQPKVIYFCDSCNAWIDIDDVDRRLITELLNDQLLDKEVVRLDGGAYHLELYEAFVDLLITRQVRPDVLIIPVNLRSFSAEWDARPAYSFSSAKQQLRRADNPVASAFSPLMKTLQWEREETPSIADFRATAVFDGEQQVGTVTDFDNNAYLHPTPELVRNKFIFHYMSSLQPQHRKLVALRNIAHQAAKHNLKILFYVTPIDYQTGTACLGERFTQQVSKNIALIRRNVSEYPVDFVDWSFALDASAFSWNTYPNEHLKEKGRSFVARNLAARLADQYAFELKNTPTHIAKQEAENNMR